MKILIKGFAVTLSALLVAACSTSPPSSSQIEPSQTEPSQTEAVSDPAVNETLEPAVVESESSAPALPPGSNEMLRSPLTVADGLEVIISDVIIPPNAATPRHYHPGEEFVYIIEGSVVHVEEGKPEFILEAGETVTLAPEVEHAPRATEEGARAIVFRVHYEGQPERILVEEEDSE